MLVSSWNAAVAVYSQPATFRYYYTIAVKGERERKYKRDRRKKSGRESRYVSQLGLICFLNFFALSDQTDILVYIDPVCQFHPW